MAKRTVNPDKITPPCPYELLSDYKRRRKRYKVKTEPFFVFSDGSLVTPIHLRVCLKRAIKKAGFDESLYSSHSLRIGRTTDLFALGLSVETIKKLGRWRSNAIFRYIRY